MKLKKIIIFFVTAIMSFSFFACKDNNSQQSILKNEDVADFLLEVESGRQVKILQLTDIQIIDSSQMRSPTRLHPWSIEKWVPTAVTELAYLPMRQIVQKTKPDLIVLSGDNVYGEFDDSGIMQKSLIAELDSYKIPWTLTFGNHDNETQKGVAYTCEQYSKSQYCLFKRGDIENISGNGNFNIGIVQDGRITEVVWLMDSNGHTDSDRAQNMFSHVGLFEDQINWFKNGSKKLKEYNNGKNISSIGFFHHPMRAFGDGLQQYGYMSTLHGFFSPDGEYGNFTSLTIPKNDLGDYGVMGVDAGQYCDSDYEFHNALKEYETEGWFFGHDHKNNASVTFEGVRYGYGLKASYYDDYTEGQIGGTLIMAGNGPLKAQNIYYSPLV